jgi:hypothetical protein
MIEIDADTAVRAMREAVEAKGRDFVYLRPTDEEDGACSYTHLVDGEVVPGCLVGDALVRLGVPVGKFRDLNINTGEDPWGAMSRLKWDGILKFSEGAADVFGEAQRQQDSGIAWGNALAHAEAKLELWRQQSALNDEI